MKFKFLKAVITALLLSASCLVSIVNAVVIYNLDRDIGIGNISGTITTDGTIGVLSTGNVTNWELELFDGSSSLTLFGTDSISVNSALLISGSAFSATASDLFYNFDISGFALFQNPSIGSGINWWCLERSGCTSLGTGESLKLTGSSLDISYSGTQLITTTINRNVPEPSTLVIFALGIIGLASLRSMKQAK